MVLILLFLRLLLFVFWNFDLKWFENLFGGIWLGRCCLWIWWIDGMCVEIVFLGSWVFIMICFGMIILWCNWGCWRIWSWFIKWGGGCEMGLWKVWEGWMCCCGGNVLNLGFNLLLLNIGFGVWGFGVGWEKLVLVLLSGVCGVFCCLRGVFKCCVDDFGRGFIFLIIVLIWVCLKEVFSKLGIVVFKLFIDMLLWFLMVLVFFYWGLEFVSKFWGILMLFGLSLWLRFLVCSGNEVFNSLFCCFIEFLFGKVLFVVFLNDWSLFINVLLNNDFSVGILLVWLLLSFGLFCGSLLLRFWFLVFIVKVLLDSLVFRIGGCLRSESRCCEVFLVLLGGVIIIGIKGGVLLFIVLVLVLVVLVSNVCLMFL